jgi:hypothetical protein
VWPDEELQFINNGKLITEPRFLVNNEADYLKLFEAGAAKKIRGESSTTYLFFHQKAIQNIQAIHPDPASVHIVIILRNPVQRAFSQYMHKVRDGAESLSFEEALEKEEWRRLHNWHFDYQYVKRGMYFDAVKNYMQQFPKCKVFLFDELQAEPDSVYRSLQEYLGIEIRKLEGNQELNRSGKPKVAWINRFLKRPHLLKSAVGKLLPRQFRRNLRLEVQKTVYRQNLVKEEMNAETSARLSKLFEEDGKRLGDLLNKDLSHWTKLNHPHL